MKKRKDFFRRQLMFLSIFLFMGSTLLAQEMQVTGKVTEAATGYEIPGVTVYLKGTTTGTITDVQGVYTIDATAGDTLVFSFIGFSNQEVAVGNQRVIDVQMEEDVVNLDEVIAVGYGVQKKKEITGAVSQVKADEMLKSVGSDFTKQLQGKVAGLSVTQSSGRPGDQAVIQIRGVGSINGNASPLYVVDGIPANGNPNIPAEEIESVDVLKDGAAAAVYGTRASNGVILITTKRGSEGEPKVSYSGYYGIQNITSGTDLLNTEQQIYVEEMYNRALGGQSPVLDFTPDAMSYNTDYLGYITNDNAPMQSHNLSLSGGKDGVTYNVNANYYDQDGILIQSGYERFSTRANAQIKKGKFDGFVSVGVSRSEKQSEPWGLYAYAQYQRPYNKPININDLGQNQLASDAQNPDHIGFLARLINQSDERIENSYNISANLKYEFIEGLVYQVNLGSNYWSLERDQFQPRFMVYDDNGNLSALGSRTEAVLENWRYSSLKYTMENIVNFNRTFGNHKLGLMGGYTIEKTMSEEMYGKKQELLSNETPVFDAASTIAALTGSETTHSIIGKVFRLQYAFNDKYMLSASGRYDGSSRFAEENRYAFFPGVSVGWNISEENFMQGTQGWLTGLKLRASYGEVGNEGIGDYRYATYIRSNVDYIWGPEANDELALGAIQRAYSNKDIKWETNISRNIGLDVNLLRGKITFTGDVYLNDKNDMLLNVLLPASSGTNHGYGNNTITNNVGNMENKGFELSTSYKGRTVMGLNWSATLVFSQNDNEITSLGELTEIPLSESTLDAWVGGAPNDVLTYMKVGYPAGSFFLIETDGVIKTQEELDEVSAYMPNAQLGDLRVIDQDGNNVIDDNDRVYKGSGLPDFETSLTLNAEYKGFDLSAQLHYSHGNQVYDGAKAFAYMGQRHVELYDMWTPQNPTSDVFVPLTDNYRPRLDTFLTDGSFLRVRNLSLGYTMPDRWLNGAVDNARVYLSAQNPFTFTDYEGYDPEVGGSNIQNRGVDKANYPITRKFLVGVQIDF